MIIWLVLKLCGFFPRLSRQAAQRIVIAGLVIVAALALIAGGLYLKGRYDRGVVEDARVAGNAKVAAGTAAANETAGAARLEDAVRSRDEARALEGVIVNAPDPVTARREFYRCRRLQQDARAARHPAPACDGLSLSGRAAGAIGGATGL